MKVVSQHYYYEDTTTAATTQQQKRRRRDLDSFIIHCHYHTIHRPAQTASTTPGIDTGGRFPARHILLWQRNGKHLANVYATTLYSWGSYRTSCTRTSPCSTRKPWSQSCSQSIVSTVVPIVLVCTGNQPACRDCQTKTWKTPLLCASPEILQKRMEKIFQSY